MCLGGLQYGNNVNVLIHIGNLLEPLIVFSFYLVKMTGQLHPKDELAFDLRVPAGM